MGLIKMAIKVEKIEEFPSLMQSLGFPIIRTEDRENGVYYFYEAPHRSNGRHPRNKYFAFWITHEKEGQARFFYGGLSQSTSQIAQSLRAVGFIDDEGAAREKVRQLQLRDGLLAKLAAKERRDRKDI